MRADQPTGSGGGGQAANRTSSANAASAVAIRPNGTAYGAELFLKRKLTRHIGGFLSCTLSRSTRTYDGQTYIASFDRSHVLNAALAFDLGRNWRAGTRVTFCTGLPKARDPTDPGTRLAPFFRTDLRVEKRWPLGRKAWISWFRDEKSASPAQHRRGDDADLRPFLRQQRGQFSRGAASVRSNLHGPVSGTFVESGVLAVQPSVTTAIGIDGTDVTIRGTVDDPGVDYAVDDCALTLSQDGNSIDGTICRRTVGTSL